MKNLLLAVTTLCSYMFCFSQENGMQFEKGMSWQQILSKAKEENKYIFVDCYTTWCGPCKFMAKDIFPLKETGDAVNPNYICVGMQIDSTDQDPETVKQAYQDAHMIEASYHIRAYPTFLYFNPEGKLVHRTVGSTKNAADFILNTQNAMNPDRQYYSMIERFRSGNRDTVMLESLTELAIQNENGFLADSVIRAWLPLIENVYTSDRLKMIAQIEIKTGTPEFDLFYHNTEKVDRIMKPDYAEHLVMNAIISQNKSIVIAFSDSAFTPDWEKIHSEIKSQYGPVYANRIVLSVKPSYYKKIKNWNLYIMYLLPYLKAYESNLDAIDLNNYAWDIFQYSSNREDLAYGLTLSERSLNDQKKNPLFLDTYANLQYKLGRKSEAIAHETEALNLTEPADKPSYQETLDKMKSGVKTWE